jgi:ribonucleotide reductase alpha subunit
MTQVETPFKKVSEEMSDFARTIYLHKYSLDGKEDWSQTSERVVSNVLGALGYGPGDKEYDRLLQLVEERKFLPGGRYLYASGRDLHQTQNCLLLRAKDSREGWAELMQKSSLALMTGAGIGIDYSDVRPSGSIINKTGGIASGPISLMKIINEIGRNVMQGGSRRSAIWAGLSWKHKDILDFINLKNWSDDIKALKEKDFNFPADMDMTNISVILDDDFFVAFSNPNHRLYEHAQNVYWTTVRNMVSTGEPGFSIDVGVNAGETLRNAPVTAETNVLTADGYRAVGDIVGVPVSVWTGMRWADAIFKKTADNSEILRVCMTGGRYIRCSPEHEFLVEDWRGSGKRRRFEGIRRVKACDLKLGDRLHVSLPHGPELGEVNASAIKVVSVEPDGTETVFCADVGVPEHSFMAEGVIISNCTEITSSDSDDICNLGSINIARINDKQEMLEAVQLGTLFLLAGTVYSHLPYEDVAVIRTKNRRLGLGLMGVHEWLLQRGKPYGPDDELAEWLDIYAESGNFANHYADLHGLTRPVKTRAIAPTGTIGIISETTTGIEPIFCVAFKRRYRSARSNGKDVTYYQYVIDPTAKRLIDQGIDPASIEDAYMLSYDVERRVKFQAWVQQWVDHGISSTINLPYPVEDAREVEDFGNMLIRYLPNLRGITVYPNGARGGQPLTAVPYKEAIKQQGIVFEEHEERCSGGICGA